MRYVCGGCRTRDEELTAHRLMRKFVVPPVKTIDLSEEIKIPFIEKLVKYEGVFDAIAALAQKSPWQNPTLNEIREMIKKVLED